MLPTVQIGAQSTCLRLNASAGGPKRTSTPSMRWKILFIMADAIVRGCPKLTDLCWYARGLTPLTDGNGENVDDLEELLESRGEQISRNTYFEIEVFPTYGPWKRNSHQYRTAHGQHPPGFQ